MKKNFKEMSYEEKKLNLKQCKESGFGFSEKINPIENLIISLKETPDFFNFVVNEKDYGTLAKIFAEVLAEDITVEFDETLFEIFNDDTVKETVKDFLISTYNEGLPCDEDDCEEMLEDLYSKLKVGFDTSAFRKVESSDIEDFMENAEFGTKSVIDDTTYFKVKNNCDNQAYTLYINDNFELTIA